MHGLPCCTLQVLRLHALSMRAAAPRAMPLAAANQPQQPSPQATLGGASVLQLRECALGLLALALGGDELAAEYVLMQVGLGWGKEITDDCCVGLCTSDCRFGVVTAVRYGGLLAVCKLHGWRC